MVIFHSYVKLPEGIQIWKLCHWFRFLQFGFPKCRQVDDLHDFTKEFIERGYHAELLGTDQDWSFFCVLFVC